MEIIPRIYQWLAIKAALTGLRGDLKRALVVLATGLGKTLTAAFITQKLAPKKVLFLVHNNFILDHAQKEFRKIFDERTTIAIYNGMSKNGAAQAGIVFATWQTMGKNLDQWERDHFDLIIVDEAHHAEAETYRPVTNYFTGAKLGITATPDREDEADIRDVFGPEVINISLEEAIARGWLPRIEYHVITDESLDEHALQEIAAEIRESKKRFTMAEVNRRIFIKKRDDEIARIINGYNEKAVVFCASIPHAERMTKSLTLASAFHSKKGQGQKDTWEKNQETLHALRNGIIRRVCAVDAFNEGVDVPSIGLVAFCRVTESYRIFRQQLGRGARPGKEKLIVLDFVGNLERIQLVLEMMNKIADLHEQYTPKGELEREGYARERFEVSGKGFEFTFSDKIVDLMKILEHCEREFYPTWQEASKAVIALGIKSSRDYAKKYKEDEKLNCNPHHYYPDFPGWTIFLSRKPKDFYPTWQEASKAAIALGIKKQTEYYKFSWKDSRLPSNPRQFYKDFPGWPFFGKTASYEDWQSATKAVQLLKVPNQQAYKKMRFGDPKLPARPNILYKDFPGWVIFLGKKSPKDFYPTWQEAGTSARRLGVTTSKNYLRIRKSDPRLPADPYQTYKNFPGWNKFLGKRK